MKLGLFLNNVSNLQEVMLAINNLQFNGLVCPIINPLHRSHNSTVESNDELTDAHLTFSNSDLILNFKEWRTVIAKLNSDSIDCDSDDASIRRASEKLILQEIQLAKHLVTGGYIMIKLTSNKNVNLARILSSSLERETCLIHVLITNTTARHLRQDLWEYQSLKGLNGHDNNPWTWWNNFRTICDYNPKYKLALELTEEVPLNNEINRWLGEPIDCIIIPRHLFYKDRKILQLPTNILSMLKKFLHLNVYFILKGNLNDINELNQYNDYIVNFMNGCIALKPTDFNKRYIRHHDFLYTFQDILLVPVTSTNNNGVETRTIEEADSVFFKSYQNAIQLALVGRVPESTIASTITVLLILEAHRGLMVKSALNAAENSNRKIKIYVVESNRYNLITLISLKRELWPRKSITIVSDLKTLDSRVLGNVDIIITSNIGSFGDNDLLPEFIQRAKAYLKPDGIAIPCQTTSYLNPIMSSTIFNNTKYTSLFETDVKSLAFEHNYIVHLHNVYHIDVPQKCFTFDYPSNDKYNNEAFKSLSFNSQLDCILHGFAGYFEAILYKNVILSTHPLNFTKGLASFFSYYFPLKEPQMIKAGEKIEINISRCTSTQRIWYEWQINKPRILPILNLNGCSFSIQKYRDE